jgi:hypothetical protein
VSVQVLGYDAAASLSSGLTYFVESVGKGYTSREERNEGKRNLNDLRVLKSMGVFLQTR